MEESIVVRVGGFEVECFMVEGDDKVYINVVEPGKSLENEGARFRTIAVDPENIYKITST